MAKTNPLQDMLLFVEVARRGSFSRASEALGVPGATLSRRIADMEKMHGVRLFDRTTRRVELTDAGNRYLLRCGPLVDDAQVAQQELAHSAQAVSGRLRLSMPVDLGVSVIGPLLPEFARQFPGVTLDLDLSSRQVDLLGERIDIAIRLGRVTDERLIARKLGHVDMALFAAPQYLLQHGEPDRPQALQHHSCVLIRGSTPGQGSHWHLLAADGSQCSVALAGRFEINNQSLMRTFAEQGLGIAPLALSLVTEAVAQGRLVPVLSAWRLPSLPIHALITSRLQSRASRELIEYLAACLAG